MEFKRVLVRSVPLVVRDWKIPLYFTIVSINDMFCPQHRSGDARKESVVPRLIIVLLVLLLSACGTIQVTEADLLHPAPEHESIERIAPGYHLDTTAVAHADGVVSRGIWLRRDTSTTTWADFGGNQFNPDQSYPDVLHPWGTMRGAIVIWRYAG